MIKFHFSPKNSFFTVGHDNNKSSQQNKNNFVLKQKQNLFQKQKIKITASTKENKT